MLRLWQEQDTPLLRVTVSQTRGSTPRETGAFMLVTATGQAGTIGGGQLEFDALAHARRILCGLERPGAVRIVLGPEAAQCCGGVVLLDFAFAEDLASEIGRIEAMRGCWPRLAVFGAGHVGRALVRALVLLPLHLIWVDARADEFGPPPDGVTIRVTETWEREIAALRAHDGALVLTPSHRLDALIVSAALERDDLAYVGMIGSHSKRRRFEAAFRETGLDQARIDRLVCPIGDVGIRDKRPEIIAALVAAEIATRLVPRLEASRPRPGAQRSRIADR